MIPTPALLMVLIGINLAGVGYGYYVGLKHVDRLLDIDEGQADPDFPPGFGARESERIGPLSADDIDGIDRWDQLRDRPEHQQNSASDEEQEQEQ